MELLLIEDDKNLSDSIRSSLTPLYSVRQAFDGAEGLGWAEENIFDLIILDIMLPEMDGFQVLEGMRAAGVRTPVLLLTARDSIGDKIAGFEKGADDYLVKPFHREELLLRIEALLRRGGRGELDDRKLRFHGLTLNLASRSADIEGEALDLQGKRFDILEYLMHNKGIIVTKEQIFTRIWGFDSDTTTNVVEVYVSGVRGELKKHGYDSYLRTVRGLGYMLTDPEENRP